MVALCHLCRDVSIPLRQYHCCVRCPLDWREMTVAPHWWGRGPLLVIGQLSNRFLWLWGSRWRSSFGGRLLLRRLVLLHSGHWWVELGEGGGGGTRLELGWLDSRNRHSCLAAGRRQRRTAEHNVLLSRRLGVNHWFGLLWCQWRGSHHRL